MKLACLPNPRSVVHGVTTSPNPFASRKQNTTVPVPKDPLPVTQQRTHTIICLSEHNVGPSEGGPIWDILHWNWTFKWHDCTLFAFILNSLSHTHDLIFNNNRRKLIITRSHTHTNCIVRSTSHFLLTSFICIL